MIRQAWLVPAAVLGTLLGCPDSAPPKISPPPALPRQEVREEGVSLPTPWSRIPVPAAPPPQDGLLELGERLYGWNCFPCHGAEGKGDGPAALRQGLHPRDFTRGLFKLKTSDPGEMPFDEDLYRTIAAGIPLGGMPRNAMLESRDRWALVAYVKSLSVLDRPGARRENHFETKAPLRRWSPPMASGDPDPARGRDLFQKGAQCATCHGPAGKGNGPAAAELRDAWDRPAPVPDLTRGELGLKSGSDLQDIFRVLTLGMAGTPMPSFAALSEKDRWDLAAYVRSLFEPISAGEKVFLVTGCTACHTIGRGKHVGPDLMDVRTRRDRSWLRQWLADPPSMMARDPATRKLFQDYTVLMPNLNLGGADIESLIDYLEGLKAPPAGK